MIKAAWNFLGTPLSFKIVSVLLCIYFAISELGRTGSYWSALNSGALFYCIWYLGFGSAKRGQA